MVGVGGCRREARALEDQGALQCSVAGLPLSSESSRSKVCSAEIQV